MLKGFKKGLPQFRSHKRTKKLIPLINGRIAGSLGKKSDAEVLKYIRFTPKITG